MLEGNRNVWFWFGTYTILQWHLHPQYWPHIPGCWGPTSVDKLPTTHSCCGISNNWLQTHDCVFMSPSWLWFMQIFRDYSLYAPSQWEMALHCNAISHWLSAYTEWSLNIQEWCHFVFVFPHNVTENKFKSRTTIEYPSLFLFFYLKLYRGQASLNHFNPHSFVLNRPILWQHSQLGLTGG